MLIFESKHPRGDDGRFKEKGKTTVKNAPEHLERKFEEGDLDWSEQELNQLPQWMKSQIESDIAEEAEHKTYLAD